MDHDSRIWHAIPLALCPRTQQESAHGCRKPKAIGLHIAAAHQHRVVDPHPRGHGASGGIDEELDVLGGVLGIEEKQLADDGISSEVVDLQRKGQGRGMGGVRHVMKGGPAGGLAALHTLHYVR